MAKPKEHFDSSFPVDFGNESTELSDSESDGDLYEAASDEGSAHNDDKVANSDAEEQHVNHAASARDINEAAPASEIDQSFYEQIQAAMLAEKKRIDPEMVYHIEAMEYPKILIGKCKITAPTFASKQLGRLSVNSPLRDLLIYANTILQTPHIRDYVHKKGKRTAYGYGTYILKYIFFMAIQGATIETFRVDGILICEMFTQYLVKKADENSGIFSTYAATLALFKYALKLFHICIGLFKTQDVEDTREAHVIMHEQYRKIPHADLVNEFIKSKRIERHKIALVNFHNKDRADTFHKRYTVANVRQMMINMYNVTKSVNQSKIYKGINAVLEMLQGHHLLFRGSNKTTTELSDVVYGVEECSHGSMSVLGFQFTQGKTITASDEPQCMGACRNKHVEICLVSAFAMSLWYRFDFVNQYADLVGSNFPDFLDKSNWYPIKVLWAKNNRSEKHKPVSYDYEASLMKMCLDSIGFKAHRVVHLPRGNSAKEADAYGISAEQIRRAGHWKTEVLYECYANSYPFDFIHFSGGFQKDEPYYIARDIEVPEELQKKFFPWLEDEIRKEKKRKFPERAHHNAKDTTAPKFFKMMKEFRRVIPQDLVIMMELTPDSIFCKHPITKDPVFIKFRARVLEATNQPELFEGFQRKKQIADVLAPSFMKRVDTLECAMERTHAVHVQKFASQASAMDRLNDQLNSLKTDSTQQNGNLIKTFRALLEEFRDKDESKLMQLQSDIHSLRNEVLQAQCGDIQSMLAGASRSQDRGTQTAEVEVACAEILSSSSAEDYDMNDNQLENVKNVSSALPPESASTRNLPFDNGRWAMSKLTLTVPALLKEWYESTDGIPSIEMRDVMFQARWRGTQVTFHKRRNRVIIFVEEQKTKNNSLRGLSRDEIGELLERHRVAHNLSLSKLCDSFAKKENLAEAAQELTRIHQAEIAMT